MKKVTTLTLVGLALLAVGCEEEKDSGGEAARAERDSTVKLQEKLRAKVGFPKPADSQELRNLKRRYEALDDPNKVGYVYLLDHGLIFAEYTVKGKVSSLESQFTNPSQVVKADFGEGWEAQVIDQAEPDGSYGRNPSGIFFFTTDGIYVEWAGNYQYSGERLEIQQPTQHLLTKPVK